MSEGRRPQLDPDTRRFLLQTRAAMTQQAGRDLRTLCLDPGWLLSSVATRPMAQVAEDLTRAGEPDLTWLGQFLDRGAHMISGAPSRAHRVNTVLAWLDTDPQLRSVVERCIPRLRTPYLRTSWALAPTGPERARTLQRHDGRVEACAFSLDGQTLTTADDRGVVVVWDVRAGAFVGKLDPGSLWAKRGEGELPTPHQGKIRIVYGMPQTRLLAGPDDRLAVLTPEGLLGVWSLDGVPAPLYILDTNRDSDGDTATFLVKRDDSETFLTRSDEAFRLRSWRTGEVLLTMPLNGQLACSCPSRDDTLFAVEAFPGVVDVWDLAARRHLAQLPVVRHDGDIARMAVDGRLLFVVDDEDLGRVWDWTSGRQLTAVSGVFDLPQIDNRYQLAYWLRRPGELVATPVLAPPTPFRHPSQTDDLDDLGPALGLRLSEHVLATVIGQEHESGDDTVFSDHRADMFDLRTGQLLMSDRRPGYPLMAVKGPHDDQLVTVTTSGDVEVWDLRAGERRSFRSSTSFSPVTAAAANSDGSCVAISVEADVHLVRPWETGSPAEYPMIGQLLDVMADPHGQWLATLTDQLELDLWNPGNGQLGYRCSGDAARTFRSGLPFRIFSPDGRWIAVQDWDGSVLVWDTASGQRLPGMRPLDGDLVHVASGPHGPVVIIRHWDLQRLSVWDAVPCRHLVTLPWSKAVAGDLWGRWLAGIRSDEEVFVWDLALGRRLPTPGTAKDLAADPAGRWLYVLGERTLIAVEPFTGRTWPLHTSDGAASVLPSGDGTACVVVRHDGEIEVIPLTPEGPTRPQGVARTRVVSSADSLRRLSTSGRLAAIADRSANSVELIDLTAPAAAPAQASATLDGHIRAMACIGDTAVAVAGTFGLHIITLHLP